MKKPLLLIFFIFSVFSFTLAQRSRVDAGPDQTIIAGQKAYLQGSSYNVRATSWKTRGTGTFSNKLTLATVYTPSKADIRNGGVTLLIYNINNPVVRDSMRLTLVRCNNVVLKPEKDTICADYYFSAIYQLNATVTGSKYYVEWTTSGTGSFFNENAPATYYETSGSDVSNGGVWLKITVYDSLKRCSPVSDSLYLKINNPPILELPDYIDACGDEPVYIESESRGPITTINWSTTGTGTFINNKYGTYYNPSLQDRIKGYVTIKGRTNDPAGPCYASMSESTINFVGPVADAGKDITICGSRYGGTISVNATSNEWDIYWTTNGNGDFDDPYSSNATYYYSSEDVNNARIELYVTVSNGYCKSFTDTVKLWLQAEPRLDFPEPSIYQCPYEPIQANVYLYGYASSGKWTTTGTGTFSDPTSTYTLYYPGADETSGCVDLIFTSNDPNGPCGPVSGAMSACFFGCGDNIRKGAANNGSNQNGHDIAVHPNPAKDLLQIKTDTEVDEEATYITDLFGNKVQLNWTGKGMINTADLQPGQYFLHVYSTEGKPSVVRFVKK